MSVADGYCGDSHQWHAYRRAKVTPCFAGRSLREIARQISQHANLTRRAPGTPESG